MYYTKKEREHYNAYRNRVCQDLGITQNQYNWFRRKGEMLRKIYENNCNGLYKTEQAYFDACLVVENKIDKNIGDLSYYLQTDPRGASLYLDTKPIPENNYTQANCIY